MSRTPNVSDRLLAQGALYARMAGECWDEALAAVFRQAARECFEDAAAIRDRRDELRAQR